MIKRPAARLEARHPSLLTSMSGYQSFAIWGAGNIGARIAVELLERAPLTGISVIILTRPVSQLCDLSWRHLLADGTAI
jgi:hypothetical protein